MRGCLLRAETGVGADFEFGEFGLSIWLTFQQGAEDGGEETKRDAEDAGIGQREDGVGLDEMPFGGDNIRSVDAHDARADDDENDAADQAHG